MPFQAAKMTEHRTATLMRHRRDCSRHNLAVLLDPNNPNNSQGQSLGSLSMDGGCNPVNLEPPVPMGLLASSTSNEDAIFTPHYETVIGKAVTHINISIGFLSSDKIARGPSQMRVQCCTTTRQNLQGDLSVPLPGLRYSLLL